MLTDNLAPLPHSLEAEAGVLGCVLLEPERAAEFLRELRPFHFYDERTRCIYRHLSKLHKAGTIPDSVSLHQSLVDQHDLENAGGLDFVTALPDNVPSVVNWPSFIKILNDKGKRRLCLEMSENARRIALDPSQDPDELAEAFVAAGRRLTADTKKPREWLKLYTPSECRAFQPPPGFVLVGDCHLVRGSFVVIGGQPGIGKSRCATALALAGATGQPWFGLPVRQRFKTLIIQAENGRYRLKSEFADIAAATLDEYVRVSDCPPYGLPFDDECFRAYLRELVEEFKPDVIVLDPWNRIALDDKVRDAREAFENIKDCLPKGDLAPCVVVIAHTRKPQKDGTKSGRALLHELSGSHALGSVPRCVFHLQAASDDQADDRVIWTCCKCNDGEAGPRTAWHRRNGLFTVCNDFDWESFDHPTRDAAAAISEADLANLFDNGNRKLAKKEAVEKLMEMTGLTKSPVYAALSLSGKFGDHLRLEDGVLIWTP